MTVKPPPHLQHDAGLCPQLPSPAASPSPASMARQRPFEDIPHSLGASSTQRLPTQFGKDLHRPCPADYPANFGGHSPLSDNGSHGPHCGNGRGHIASPAALATYEKLGAMPDHSEVFRVDQSRVLKTGPDVTLQEAGCMDYLFSNSTVPVPRILDFGTEPETGNNYILMEYADGDRLDIVWDALEPQERAAIVAQLRSIFLDLRSINDAQICAFVPDAAGAGRYSKTGVTDNFFARPQGPFSDEGGLLHALAAHLQLRGGPASCWLDRVVLPLLFNMPAHPPLMVLTHGELNAKNVLVKDGKITAILDWSQSGFYPTYWEFVKAFFGDVESSVLIRDNAIAHILDQRYDAELAVMLLARDIIW